MFYILFLRKPAFWNKSLIPNIGIKITLLIFFDLRIFKAIFKTNT
jgi:hypothetical protein